MSKSSPRNDSAFALALSIALFCAAGVVGISIFQFALGSEPEDTRYTLAVRAAVSWLGLVPLGLLCVWLALLGAMGVMRGGFAPTRGAIGGSALALGLALLFGALVQGSGGAVGDALPNLGGLAGRLGAALLGLLVVFASAWITWIAPARSGARVRQVDRGIAAALSHQDEHDGGVSAAEAEALYPITPLAGRGPAAPAPSAPRAAPAAASPTLAQPLGGQASAEPVVRPLERAHPIEAAPLAASSVAAPAAPRSSIPVGARPLEAPAAPRSFEAPPVRPIPEGAQPLGRPASALAAAGGATELEDEVGPALPFEPSWERRASDANAPSATPVVAREPEPDPEPELEVAPIAEPSWSRALESEAADELESECALDENESEDGDEADERVAPAAALAEQDELLEDEELDEQDEDERTDFAPAEPELDETREVEVAQREPAPIERASASASVERAAELQASLFEAPEDPAVCADELAQREDEQAAGAELQELAPAAAQPAASAAAAPAPSKRAQRRAAKAREAAARAGDTPTSDAGEDYTLQPRPTRADGRAQPVSEREKLVFDAGCLILEHGRVAVSLLQRSFQLDFKQATELLDELQQRGLIGPYVGGMRRDILLEREDWLARSTR